jgi:hypothetical protein
MEIELVVCSLYGLRAPVKESHTELSERNITAHEQVQSNRDCNSLICVVFDCFHSSFPATCIAMIDLTYVNKGTGNSRAVFDNIYVSKGDRINSFDLFAFVCTYLFSVSHSSKYHMNLFYFVSCHQFFETIYVLNDYVKIVVKWI